MAIALSRSLWFKLLLTLVAMVSFVLLYEVGTFDSLTVAPRGAASPASLAAGTPHLFTATAYCKGTTTASGVNVRTGIAAGDPTLLPVGSVVNITTRLQKYNGVYTMMDTGPKVQGRLVDIYMWSCHDALAFGRQSIEVTVLRLGWNPGDSVPSLVDRLFRRREANRATMTRPVVPAPVPEDEGDIALPLDGELLHVPEPPGQEQIDVPTAAPEVEPPTDAASSQAASVAPAPPADAGRTSP